MSEYKWNTDAFDAIRIVAANGEFEINGTDGTQVVLETMERNRHSFGSEPSIVGRWLYLNPFGGSSEMSLELPKSKAWTIEVACASGEVEIENVHARIGVQLGSGDVRLENCRGTFNLRAGSGDVRLENCVQSEVPQVPEQPTAEQQANMHNMPPGVPPMPPGAPPIPPIPPVPPIPGMGPMPGMPGMPPMPPGGFKVRMGRRGPGNGDNWEDYGREWEEWGERFGEQVSHWAENLTRSFSFGVDFGPDDQATGDGFHVRLGHGDVQFEDIDALVVSTRVGSGDVQIEQGRIAELDIENSRGDIQIEAVLPTGAWEVITRHGDVQLVLPGDAHVRIDAATRHGDIECEAPLVRVGRPGPGSRHGGRMVGTIGEGQGDPVDIHLESQHGDIQIELDRRPSRFQGQATQKGTRTERRANEPQSAAVVAREPVAPAAPRTATQPAPNAVVPVTITDLNEPEAALNAPPKAQAQVYDSQFAILQALQAGEITVAEAEMLLRSLH